ncbi:hypothetical protein NL676_011845 [Syzygium grande]|nr:hypothetical protein NL676_011845 [Syzygium grande]
MGKAHLALYCEAQARPSRPHRRVGEAAKAISRSWRLQARRPRYIWLQHLAGGHPNLAMAFTTSPNGQGPPCPPPRRPRQGGPPPSRSPSLPTPPPLAGIFSCFVVPIRESSIRSTRIFAIAPFSCCPAVHSKPRQTGTAFLVHPCLMLCLSEISWCFSLAPMPPESGLCSHRSQMPVVCRSPRADAGRGVSRLDASDADKGSEGSLASGLAGFADRLSPCFGSPRPRVPPRRAD